MSKSAMTVDLEHRLILYTGGQFGCDEVTINSYGFERVDFLTWDFKGVWRCYEIKASKPDFHSKARKTFVGNYNYYVMPDELYKDVKDEIPDNIGVLVPLGETLLQSRKKASKQNILVDERVLSASLIRSLYRTYSKLAMEGHKPTIDNYMRRIAQLEAQLAKRKEDDFRDKAELWKMKHFLRRNGLMQKYQDEEDKRDGWNWKEEQT